MRPVLSHAVGALSLLLSLSAVADQVYQCRDAAGKVTFSNMPCKGEAEPSPAAAQANGYDSIYGAWRGETQLKQTVSGIPSGTAHIVAPMTLTFAADGKVTGASSEAGCKVLGIATPGLAPNLLSVDLTLSSCSEQSFNRRYNGTFAMYPAQRYATLQLIGSTSPLLEKPASHSINGLMRR